MSRKKFVPEFEKAIFNFVMPDKSNRFMVRWQKPRDRSARWEVSIYDNAEKLGTWLLEHSHPCVSQSVRLINKTIKAINQKTRL